MSFILRALVWLWCVLMLVLVAKSFVLKHIMAFSLRHNEMNHTCCWCYYEFFIELNMALSWKACRWFSIARKYTFCYCKQHMYIVQCTSKRRTLCEHIRQINIRFRREKVEYNKTLKFFSLSFPSHFPFFVVAIAVIPTLNTVR